MLRTAAGALALSFLVTPAAAQTCGPTDQVAEVLAGQFREDVIGWGMTETGLPVMLWAADDGRSFTVTVTLPEGQTCIIAAGVGWEAVQREPNL